MLIAQQSPHIIAKNINLMLVENSDSDFVKYKATGSIRTSFDYYEEKPFISGNFFTCFLPPDVHRNLHQKLINSEITTVALKKILFGAGFNYNYNGVGLYNSICVHGPEQDIQLATSSPGKMANKDIVIFNQDLLKNRKSISLRWVKYPELIFNDSIIDFLNDRVALKEDLY